MDRCRNSGESSQRREPVRRERISGKKIKVCEKVEKVAKHCVFPMFCGCGGSNERSKFARHCGAKQIWSSKQFWQLRCRKSARDCGAKHVSK